jgi:UDP-glucose 6-dehydrogenase
MTELIIGYGEIGKAVKEVICPDAHVYDIAHDKRSQLRQLSSLHNLDIMHICIPYSEDFVKNIKKYIELLKPKHVIVYSTVPIGTCRLIDEKVVHSPVEGRHPYLASSIKDSRRWIGFNNGGEGKFFVDYFKNFSVWFVSSTETTELVKLRSTAKYGVNLIWAQYEVELCEEFGVSYDQVMNFDRDYNETYKNDSYTSRYILYPPNNKIGGHCVVSNAKLLNRQFHNDMLDKIIEMEA